MEALKEFLRKQGIEDVNLDEEDTYEFDESTYAATIDAVKALSSNLTSAKHTTYTSDELMFTENPIGGKTSNSTSSSKADGSGRVKESGKTKKSNNRPVTDSKEGRKEGNKTAKGGTEDVLARVGGDVPLLGEHTAPELLMPHYLKVNRILNERGFPVYQFSPTSVDLESKSISVHSVDMWVETILMGVTELVDRLQKLQNATTDASISAKQGDVSQAALQSRIEDLQIKLLESEKKERRCEQKLRELEDEKELRLKKHKVEDHEVKKITRNLEQQIAESERRVRQKDIENERLREKLRSLASKEKDTSSKHRATLVAYKQYGLSSSSLASSASSPSSPTHYSPSSSRTSHLDRSHVSKGRSPQPTAADVIEALEAQRDGFLKRNAELDKQVADMAELLRRYENGETPSQSLSGIMKMHSVGGGQKKSQGSTVTATGVVHNGAVLEESFNDSFFDENSANEQSFFGGGASQDAVKANAARNLYSQIDEQRRRIDQLNHRCEVYKNQQEESEKMIGEMRTINADLQDEVENLKLDLSSRPTMRQWKQKQKELEDLEAKVHDLVMMRGEAKEIAAWRKHLNVTDRIKVDKRNHELGLWLMESLPKTVMKETLQSVCRELDLSDVAEIQPAIVKLKTVLKAVPRMESFIMKVCNFVLERDRFHNADERPSMEDILPALKRWWGEVELASELKEFRKNISNELQRRTRLLSETSKALLLKKNSTGNAEGTAETASSSSSSSSSSAISLILQDNQNDNNNLTEQDQDFIEDVIAAEGLGSAGSRAYEKALLAERTLAKAPEIIRELVDLEISLMIHKNSFKAAECFIKEQPDTLLSRILSHLQYLFEVKSLEGLLPKCNQIYLQREEMNNFLKALRETMGMEKSATDATVMSEIHRRVASAASFRAKD